MEGSQESIDDLIEVHAESRMYNNTLEWCRMDGLECLHVGRVKSATGYEHPPTFVRDLCCLCRYEREIKSLIRKIKTSENAVLMKKSDLFNEIHGQFMLSDQICEKCKEQCVENVNLRIQQQQRIVDSNLDM